VAEFSWVPLATSLVVALGGLLTGWLVYRNVTSAEEDPIKKLLGPVHTLLKNKYYFDELYDAVFVKPLAVFSEKVVYEFMDRKVIDGFLHKVAELTFSLGTIFREKFDLPVINKWFGDGIARQTQNTGEKIRKIQTGNIQQYMVIAVLGAFVALFAFWMTLN